MKYVDLTGPEYQGDVNRHFMSGLDAKGFYRLPFVCYTKTGDKTINLDVEVAHVFKDKDHEGTGIHLIVVKSGDQYQDFYYSGAQKRWKFLSDKDTIGIYNGLEFSSDFTDYILSLFPDDTYKYVVIGIDGDLNLILNSYEN